MLAYPTLPSPPISAAHLGTIAAKHLDVSFVVASLSKREGAGLEFLTDPSEPTCDGSNKWHMHENVGCKGSCKGMRLSLPRCLCMITIAQTPIRAHRPLPEMCWCESRNKNGPKRVEASALRHKA
mmetsp:Transcript_14951/g.28768  ORF Transcript_14951/g.28768 Transcript_14951/m.28768 type:complete len:125 (-) Transcript_14951:63-437(-)